MTTSVPTPAGRPWQDISLPAEKRAELLLQAMTLEEKVAQLGSRWVGNDMAEPELPAEEQLNVAPMQDVFAAGGSVSLEDASWHGLGHLTRVWGSVPLTVEEGVAELVRQHEVVLSGSRLGVPAIVHEECLTGFTTYGATVYPTALAWGATFDPALVERMAAAIGRDMAAAGVHQGLSPVLDVVRDYRWGRVEETIGEDPYLVAMIGSAYVRGLQSAGVIATLKHFAGYSAARSGRNHGPVSIGRRELLDVILPTFETAIATAGAGSVMTSYSDLDGLPAGVDPWLFTELLRDEWGFEGTVVSDYWAVPFLATMHRVAADPQAAGALALTAGTDVELPDTIGFGGGLVDRVRSGELSEDLVDRATRRVLLQKTHLGLLDPDWTPTTSVALSPQPVADGAAVTDAQTGPAITDAHAGPVGIGAERGSDGSAATGAEPGHGGAVTGVEAGVEGSAGIDGGPESDGSAGIGAESGPPGSVGVGGELAGGELDSVANRLLAREIAERSVVLLDPGTALPLLGDDRPALQRIAVTGPCAGDPRTFMGCYAFPNHVLPRYPDRDLGIEVLSAVDALGNELPGVNVLHTRGCPVLGDDRSGFSEAVDNAHAADLCIAYVGDLSGLFGHGSSGEGCDAEDLRLPGVQAELLEQLLDTGTPVVIVVVSGRPYALGDFADRAAGLVQAFLPGQEGGRAIAGVLSGRINPGGKLPVQIPRTPGGQPATYLQPPLGSAESAGISGLETVPLYPFGFGSSYTTFEVGDLRLSSTEVPTDGEFTATVRVRNTGKRAGDEVVQLYLHDLVAQVARPVKLLTGFARVSIEPGRAIDVTFHVHADRTAYTGPDLRRIVEAGDLEVLVGTSSSELPCRGVVRLTGNTRVVGHDRRMSTPVDLTPVAGEV